MSDNKPQTFEHWCLVELFGHQRTAGLVTEATIGGCSFVRVDVPECRDQPAYTRYFGQGAIYSMTPISEEIAKSALEYLRPRPVATYMLPQPKMDDSGNAAHGAGMEAEGFDNPYDDDFHAEAIEDDEIIF